MEHAKRTAVILGAALVLTIGSQTDHVQARGQAQRRSTCVYNRYILKNQGETCRPRAITYPSYVTGGTERAVYNGALTFGVPYRLLVTIATCESGLNPKASNGTHFGLFQFLPATFRRNARLMRRLTGIRAHTYWNPIGASYVAAFMFADDHHFEWTCQ